MSSSSLSTTRTMRNTAVRGTTWLDWLRRVLHAVESRRHLVEMDDRMLSDIGISRTDAIREATRAPWDLTPPRR
ncbi:DUF1127 domain-containing protein [Neoroseomonas rubea]|uniref:DUF1127 domain-containing protein n=1 Tax=Neoroseomonas rubea TaxID=2748666 RepID=UPI0018DF9EBC|nr:DUF1127 domain-containing protein [Roseomonas rubea]